MQEIENRILDTVFIYCKNNNIIDDVASLCYDGIMILKEKYNNDLLNEFSNIIYNKFGLVLKFVQKEMDNYLNILDDHIINKNIGICHTFNKRYLLDREGKNEINTLVDNFINDPNIKSLNIKSPYDTGKTQLLKYIFRSTKKFKRVLWVSYRITLTNDLLANFEEFGFKSYKDGNYDEDRLILQAESLLNLTLNKNKINKYDLIIIDEIESVLNQFSSPTFDNDKKHKTKSTCSFNLMVNIIKFSKKLISLDGDLNERGFKFINNFGLSCNIFNEVQVDKKEHVFINDLSEYEKKIFNDIDNGLNIVVSTMNSKYGNDLYSKIQTRYPNIKIMFYYTHTDDKDKHDIKNLINIWGTLRVLIYTPTIEAGVSFDKVHFNKFYGYICGKSCSFRSLSQMTKRVRKIESDTFLYYCQSFFYDQSSKIWTYEEVEKGKYYEKNKVLVNEYEEDQETGEINIIRKNKLYRDIILYNKVESLNSSPSNFLKSYINLLLSKGHTVNYENLKYNNMIENNKTDDNNDEEYIFKVVDLIISTISTLSDNQFEHRLKIQQGGKATKNNILEIEKYLLIKEIGKEPQDIINNIVNIKHIVPNLFEMIDEAQNNNYSSSDLQLFTSTDISDEEFEENLKLQRQSIATKIIKLQIEKYLLKRALGVDVLPLHIIHNYKKYKSIVPNLLSLIDPENIRLYNEIKKDNEIYKIKEIHNILNFLEINIFSNTNNFVFDSDNFNNKVYGPFINYIKNNVSNKKSEEDLQIFKISFSDVLPSDKDLYFIDQSMKQKLGFINKFFNIYGLKFQCFQDRNGGGKNKANFYKFCIDEDLINIINNRVNYKGLKIRDNFNIYKYVHNSKNNELLKYIDKNINLDDLFIDDEDDPSGLEKVVVVANGSDNYQIKN